MAHKKGLDGSYLQPTQDECFTEFIKAIPELTIDPTEWQIIAIQKKQSKIEEIEIKEKKIKEMQETHEIMKQEIESLKEENITRNIQNS